MDANQEELPHLEPFRLKLGGIVTEALEIYREQAAITVRKQEMSKLLRQLLNQGQRLATVVRAVVKEHYGIGEEKVAEFGVQPFRGRKAKRAPEETAPLPPLSPISGEPEASDR